MNIIPFNINKIAFKGSPQTSENKSDVNSVSQKPSTYTISQNPITAAQIGVKTPVSYKKITEIPIPECKTPAVLYKLATGQKVVILPKDGPAVVRTFFNVGSMNEPEHLRGISHYIEHNLFNGTDNLGPGEFFQKVSDLGAATNAMTGYNQTNYYIKSQLLKDNSLEEIIKLHADQVQNPKFALDQLEKEKGPVTSEISMYADSPFNIGRNVALKNLYQINTNSKDLIAGSIQNINAIKREDVVDYYNTWYTPDNAITVITGDVNPDEAINLISKNFTKTKVSNPQNKKFEELTPTQKPIRIDVKSPKSPATLINMGFVGPENINTKDKIAMEVLSVIMSGYTNARLTKALEPLHCEAECSMEKIGNKIDDKQAFFIGAAAPEEKSEEALKIIYQEISKIAQNPPSQEEFGIAVNKIRINLAENNESAIQLNEFIGTSFLDNDLNYLSNYKNILETLTAQDIQNAAKKYLDLNKTSISVVHPSSSSNETIALNYQKTNSKKPAQIAFGSSKINTSEIHSKVKEYKLQNNIEVAINPIENDFAIYEMNFNLPNFLDVSGPELMILQEMLNRGSMYNNNETFHNLLEKSNIEMGFGTCPLGINVIAKAPKDKTEAALAFTKEVLLSPRFDQENFEFAKQSVKQLLQSLSKNANDKLDAQLYPHLKFTATRDEALKSLENISLEKIQAIYQTIINNASGRAVLSAPIESNPQITSGFLNSLSTGLPTLKPCTKNIIKTYAPAEKAKIVTDTEVRNQAEIVQAHKFQTAGNIEDQAKLLLLNMILGGNSSSRLFSDLRESQKLAYYVSSKLEQFGDTSTIKLNIMTTTDDPNDPSSTPDNINKSLAGYDKHINKLKTEQVSQAELEKAKLILKNNLLNSIETSAGKTIDLADSQSTSYGINKTKLLLEAIEKTNVKDIQNAANYAFKHPPITSILASQKSLEQAGIKEA